jgi:hypothetical protein
VRVDVALARSYVCALSRVFFFVHSKKKKKKKQKATHEPHIASRSVLSDHGRLDGFKADFGWSERKPVAMG